MTGVIDKTLEPFEGLIFYSNTGMMKGIKFYAKHCNREDLNMALFSSALEGHEECVKFLVSLGADEFNEAMCGAASNGHLNIVRFLIGQGANNFNLAMKNAARAGSSQIIELLVSLGANDWHGSLERAIYSATHYVHGCDSKNIQNVINFFQKKIAEMTPLK